MEVLNLYGYVSDSNHWIDILKLNRKTTKDHTEEVKE